jgi:hypothetical protein
VLGVVGRESGQARLAVVAGSARAELEPRVLAATAAGATVNTDEWHGYNRLPAHGRIRKTVCHQPGKREWARDDDGDGIREVHNNTIEGIWTGLRNFLRPFRGVSKHYLSQYVAVYQWMHNLKAVTPAVLHAVFGGFTKLAS